MRTLLTKLSSEVGYHGAVLGDQQGRMQWPTSGVVSIGRVSRCRYGYAIRARDIFDEDLLGTVRNKKRKAYSSTTHLPIIRPDICMLDRVSQPKYCASVRPRSWTPVALLFTSLIAIGTRDHSVSRPWNSECGSVKEIVHAHRLRLKENQRE